MIEGLKVTLVGTEMRDLCEDAADHHAERQEAYARQIASMQADKVEGMQYTNGDPVRALTERRDDHANREREMRFIAAHIDLGERYVLDWDALRKLGIVKDRY